MSHKLSYLEAYKAMECFLEKYYQETSSDDIGLLLGETQILEDGKTADPAAWESWLHCIKKTTESAS